MKIEKFAASRLARRQDEVCQQTPQRKADGMQLLFILRKLYKLKGFVYACSSWADEHGEPRIEIGIEPRRGSRPICPQCHKPRSTYDHQPRREWRFIPVWSIATFFLYAPRRVNCPDCGVKVEEMPWSDGKSPQAVAFSWHLAMWSLRMSWSATAKAFGVTWDAVFQSVRLAVAWGLEHRDLSDVTAIGVDEIQWGKGQTYVTLVYEIGAGSVRLLWMGQKHTAKTLLRFFRWFGKERLAQIRFVASDMWRPYLKVIAKKIPNALHVLDRYHIVASMNKALDQVRAEEVKRLKSQGLEAILKHSRWCFLKRPWNLTKNQGLKLAELVKHNLRSVRAYLLKEEFQYFWQYRQAYWAGRFMEAWCKKAMRSKIEPMKKVARSLRKHRELILNWFRAQKQISSGIVEGMNNHAKTITKSAYGFRSYDCMETALFHRLGKLPVHEIAHRFL